MPAGRRGLRVFVLVALLTFAADLGSKLWAVSRLPGRPVRVLGGAVTLRVTRNPGAAFSLATGMTLVLTLVAAAVVVLIVRMARRGQSTGWAVGLGLVLGGALGNLVDRFFRDPAPLRGHVVDFVDLGWWPVFNVADAAIVVGGGLCLLLAWRQPGDTEA